jgi:hypothetical protein
MASTFIEERYQLICCSTGKPLQLNGLTAVFVYSGVNLPDNHPDDFTDVVITGFKTVSGIIIKGCYKILEEECTEEEWNEFKWYDTFTETTCVKDCFECLPEPVIVKPLIEQKTIYPEFIVNNVDPDKAESIFCTYANMNYKKVLALRYGIEFCCPYDLVSATIDFEILKMDIATDSKACCPTVIATPCFEYSVTVGPISFSELQTYDYYLHYKDCTNKEAIIKLVNMSKTEYVLCGVTGQTVSDIYVYSNSTTVSTVPVLFSESTTSC